MTLDSAKLIAEDSAPFELKGSLFTLTVLSLRQVDLSVIALHLTQKAKQAPGFFDNTPVVIDVEALGDKTMVDFAGLYSLLRGHSMVPVGVRNGTAQLQAAAALAGWPTLPKSRAPLEPRKTEKPEPVSQAQNRIVTQPVRTGQQIYVPNGDLILLGAISAGAEILADGNIHVYGTLRGRALAGVKGDTEARIFCHSLEADLVAVAGHYRLSEHIEQIEKGKPVQVYLAEDRLIISPLFK